MNLEDGQCSLGEYFVKSGWDAAAEIACGTMKTARSGNLTAMALLRRFTSTGDADALALWHEWETATCGRKQMTWSRGLRARLQMMSSEADEALAEVDDVGAERTDEDIAGSQDRGDGPVLILDPETWRRVGSSDLLWRLLEEAEQAPTRFCSDRSTDRAAVAILTGAG